MSFNGDGVFRRPALPSEGILIGRKGGLWAILLGLALLSPLRPAESSEALDLAKKLNQAFVEVAEGVSPCVVVLQVSRRGLGREYFDLGESFWDLLPPELREQFERNHPENPENEREPRENRRRMYQSSGSGVVISEDGYILTNRHVVEGAESILVRFLDGREYEGVIQGEDVQSDIAVIKIDATGLSPIKIGDSDRTRVGEFAIAIGAPFDLDYSFTFGHVSAKGRSRIIPDITMDQNFIQTDANINPGNSGGPLVNIEGEIIGVNTLIKGLRTGIGFAIPINLAMEVAERLISDGKYVRSWLGVGIRALRENQEYRALVTEIEEGVVVSEIRPDGPAHGSDLRANDIITAVDGVEVKTPIDLKAAIRSKPVGVDVVLTVHRLSMNEDGSFTGRNVEVRVAPQPMPENLLLSLAPGPEAREAEEETADVLGMKVEALTRDRAREFGVDHRTGVIVTEVETDSEAALKGVRPGDIVTEINQKPVSSPGDFRQAVEAADLKKGLIVNFTSRNTSRFIILKQGAP